MNILITGAAGFIGSNLTKQLLSLGHNVTGIDNFSYGYKRNLAELTPFKNFNFIEGNLLDYKIFPTKKIDILVHLASHKIPLHTSVLQTMDDNYNMLKNVINKCLADKAKLVFASTSDVYGKNPNLPFNENSDIVLGQPKVRRWVYSLSKLYSENYIHANHQEYGLNFTIARFFGAYGINQNITYKGGPQSVFIHKALLNEPMDIHGDGTQTRTFSFIEDMIEILVHCIFDEKASNETFNIACNPDEEISMLDLGKLIWKLIRGENDPPKLNYIPYANFGEWEDVKRRIPDISKVRSLFNFTPRYSLEDGLKKTIEWQRKLLDL